jgi:hypothetical protein
MKYNNKYAIALVLLASSAFCAGSVPEDVAQEILRKVPGTNKLSVVDIKTFDNLLTEELFAKIIEKEKETSSRITEEVLVNLIQAEEQERKDKEAAALEQEAKDKEAAAALEQETKDKEAAAALEQETKDKEAAAALEQETKDKEAAAALEQETKDKEAAALEQETKDKEAAAAVEQEKKDKAEPGTNPSSGENTPSPSPNPYPSPVDKTEKEKEKVVKVAEENKKSAEQNQKEAEAGADKATADNITKIKAALANVKDFSKLKPEAIKALGLSDKQVEALKKANVTKATTDEDIKKALKGEAETTPNTQNKGAKDLNGSGTGDKSEEAEVPFYKNAWIMVPSGLILLSAIGGGAYMMTRKTEDTDL